MVPKDSKSKSRILNSTIETVSWIYKIIATEATTIRTHISNADFEAFYQIRAEIKSAAKKTK